MISAFLSLFYVLVLLVFSPLQNAVGQLPPTQCVTTVAAAGSGDAIQFPQLPCWPTTTLVLVKIAAANTTSTPTISVNSGTAIVIQYFDGTALQVGELQSGQYRAMSYNGTNWFLLTGQLASSVASRILLASPANLYVATNGTDVSNCTASSAPCLTLQYACAQAVSNYDQRGQNININVTDGVYNNSGCHLAGPLAGSALSGGTVQGSIWIIGDLTNYDNVVINGAAGPGTFLIEGGGMSVVLEGMKITNATGNLVFPSDHGVVDLQGVDLGNTGSPAFGMLHPEDYAEIKVSPPSPGGVSLIMSGTNTAGMIQACCTAKVTFIEKNQVIKIVGNLTVATGFISEGMNSAVYINSNFVSFDLSSGPGSIIGPQYSISTGSTLWTQSGPHNTYLPGSLAGVMASNATYRPEDGATYTDARTGLGYLATGINLNLFTTPGGATVGDCQTGAPACDPQYAINQALTQYDAMGHNIVVNFVDGTVGPLVVNNALLGAAGGSSSVPTLFLLGDQTTPTNVVIAGGASTGLTVTGAGMVTTEGISFTSSSIDGILSEHGAQVAVFDDNLGAASIAQLHADSGGQINIFGPDTINGSATNSLLATNGGNITCTISPKTITLSGALTFTDFAEASDLSLINCSNANTTFVVGGSVTGTRFTSIGNSVIDTAGAPNFWPGSINGSTATGGQAF